MRVHLTKWLYTPRGLQQLASRVKELEAYVFTTKRQGYVTVGEWIFWNWNHMSVQFREHFHLMKLNLDVKIYHVMLFVPYFIPYIFINPYSEFQAVANL